MKNIRDHGCYESALDNVIEMYQDRGIDPTTHSHDSPIWKEIEGKAEKQATELLDAGMCFCCQ